jgi:hypothetical protein
MDAGLIPVFVKAGKSRRDRLLIFMEAVTHLPVEKLRNLTLQEALWTLEEMPGRPFVTKLTELVRNYAKKEGIDRKGVIFPSRKKNKEKNKEGNVQGIGRTSVWKMVRDAVVSVLGVHVEGAFTQLRASFPIAECDRPRPVSLDDLVLEQGVWGTRPTPAWPWGTGASIT